MSNEQIPQEDYVLVPRRKARISGTRKLILGVMAVGAFAAIGGAGTFASFSASTTNDSTFNSGTLILTNKANSGNTCWSSKVDNTSSPSDDADLDANDTTCDAFFPTKLLPGATATSFVTIRNEGTTSGTLKLFATGAAACVNQLGDAKTNEVQRVTIDATGGTFTITYASQTTSALAFNASASTVQTAFQALSSVGSGNATVSKDGSSYLIAFVGTLGSTNVAEVTASGASLTGGAGTATPATVSAGGTTLPSGSKATVSASTASGLCARVKIAIQQVDGASSNTAVTGSGCALPYDNSNLCGSNVTAMKDINLFATAAALNGTLAAGETRFYRVVISLPANAASTGTCDSAGSFAFDSTTGRGCDNEIMNAKANTSLRWQLQSA